MKLKHIDLIEDCVRQDAREVKRKFSKIFDTYFFPVGDEIKFILRGLDFLVEERGGLGK